MIDCQARVIRIATLAMKLFSILALLLAVSPLLSAQQAAAPSSIAVGGTSVDPDGDCKFFVADGELIYRIARATTARDSC